MKRIDFSARVWFGASSPLPPPASGKEDLNSDTAYVFNVTSVHVFDVRSISLDLGKDILVSTTLKRIR